MIEDGDEIIVLDKDNKPGVIYKGLKAYIMVDGKMVEIQEEQKKKGKRSVKAGGSKAGDIGN